jgi:hypothetical protein
MALVKQIIDVPFGLGIDTKTDEKNVLPGKLLTLENAVFDKIGRVAKRPGVAAVPASAAGALSGTLYAAESALVVRESIGGTSEGTSRVISASDQQQLIQPSSFSIANAHRIFTRLECDQLAPVTGTAAGVDGALDPVGRLYGLCATVDSIGDLALSSFDFVSKRQLASAPLTGGNLVNARVLPSGTSGAFLIGRYSTAGSLIITRATISGGTITGYGTALATFAGLNVTGRWDWALSDNGASLYVAVLDAAGVTCTVRKYNTTTWATTDATFAVAGVTALGLGLDVSNANVGVVWTTAAGVFYRAYTTSSMALATATVTITGTAATYELATISGNSAGEFHIHVQVSNAPAATYNRAVLTAQINLAGAFMAPFPRVILGGGLACKMAPASRTWGRSYDSPLQRSLLFQKTVDGAVGLPIFQGRTLYGRHGGLISNHCIPYSQDIPAIGGGYPNSELDFFTTTLSAQESTATAVATNDLLGPTWVQAQQPGGTGAGTTYLTASDRVYPSASFAGRTIFGGGVLHRMSPSTGVEVLGLLTYPGIVSVTPAAAGGSLADGAYSVVCTYECVDSDGNVWESGPSLPVSGTVSGGGGAGQLTVVVQNYRAEYRADIYVVFYRTVAGGTTYYRERRVLMSSSTDFTSQVLTLAAASLSTAGILYSQGEQENAQPDGPITLCADQDRLWCVPGSSRNRVLPSKPFTRGVGLAFFPEVYRQVASQGDAILNLQRQDDRLYAFKSTTTHTASGAGPDATGNNDNLSDFSELFNDIGAEAVNSVVKGPLGLYVKNATDIWYIGRDLQRSRIGADVEALCATQQLLAAGYCTQLRQVRFLYGRQASTTFELVFDEELQQWSYNTRPSLLTNDTRLASFAYFDGAAHYVFPQYSGAATASLFREDQTVFTDIGVGYSLKLVTAWLKPAQAIQGYGRIYKALLVGNNLASHTLQVRVRFDYETAWSETHTITSANATAGSTVWQPELRFTRQKCEAFQLEISDITPTGQGFNLSGLELTVGTKPGSNRMSATKRF